MKVSLISVSTTPSDQGIRTISSCLKKAGHQTNLIFLPESEDYKIMYKQEVLSQLKDLCKDSKLIGLSSYASTSKRASQIIKELKPLNIPIIYGGVHATISPNKCIKETNLVCIGEGEEAIVELANKLENNKDISKIKNLWIKKDIIIKNPLRKLIKNLDTLPYADYDIENHYILDKKIRKFKESDLGGYIFFLTGRGCPYGCTYCSNNHFNQLFKNKGKIVRWHSPEYIINQILNLTNKYKSLKIFDIRDDTFSLRPTESIKEFCTLYKEKINLRMKCLGDPRTTTDEKIKLLVDAGCTDIIIGIQGQERVNKEIYKRAQTDEYVRNAALILNKHKNKLAVMYDVITSNPYETPEDILNLIKLIRSLPKPFYLSVNNLVFFPGTELYNKALKDGTIKTEKDSASELNYWDRFKHIKLKKKNAYLNLILNLMRGVTTETRYGLLPDKLLNKLLKEKRVNKNLKNPKLTLLTCNLLSVSDFTREKIAKPIYRSLPTDFKIWYDKVRYRV